MSGKDKNIKEDATLSVDNVPESTSDLTALKEIAKTLDIDYHPSIGIEKLTDKINAKTALIDMATKADTIVKEAAEAKKTATPVETKMQKYSRMRADALKLIRVRINCMNPNKQKWPGEILTVRNRVIGTVKKFIPYNLESPYHIPEILYKHLLSRQCQIFYEISDGRGKKKKVGKLIKEFSIEVLPDLTPKELKDLADQQAISRSID